jgi:hypothetical protein
MTIDNWFPLVCPIGREQRLSLMTQKLFGCMLAPRPSLWKMAAKVALGKRATSPGANFSIYNRF